MSAPSLKELLARGDAVAVEQGRLTIVPASGRPVPIDWLDTHSPRLVIQVAKLTGATVLEYTGYSVGRYGPTRAGGITLQFHCLATGQELFTIFNADTTRTRTTRHGKAGEPLPTGQFRVGKRSAFLRFWQSTGLPYQRSSNLHQRMGNLGELVYTADIGERNRLSKTTLQPLDITAELLRQLTSNSQAGCNQLPSNMQATVTNKDCQQRQQLQAIQRDSITGTQNYGNTLIRGRGYTGNPTPPEEQSEDEWLADYDRVDRDTNIKANQ
jgi:hypothetical protein